MKIKQLKTIEDFESVKKGDLVACEFWRDLHDYPKQYRIGAWKIHENKTYKGEIILQKKNNLYFSYRLFVEGTSNLKKALLITMD